MKKIERILAMIVLLLENERLSTAMLAERFGVSQRTIFRDIETIEHSGFPVLSIPGRNGGFSFVPSFKLGKLTYTNQEKQELLAAINMKRELLGALDNESVVKEKISLMYDGQEEAVRLLSVTSATVHRPEIERQIQRKIDELEPALSNNQKLQVEYVGSSGEFSFRVIAPYELSLLNGSWYLFGFCELRQAFRYFKLTRIRQINVLSERFEKKPAGNKKWPRSENQLIQLRFGRESLGRLYDYYLEEELEIGEEHVIVSFYSVNLQTILIQLLIFGAGVQVLQPQELQLQHKKLIEELAKTYKY